MKKQKIVVALKVINATAELVHANHTYPTDALSRDYKNNLRVSFDYRCFDTITNLNRKDLQIQNGTVFELTD